MRTTGRSESMNAFVKRFISSQTLLVQFIKQVSVAVDVLAETSNRREMQQKLNNVVIRTSTPLEIHASTVLTKFAFKKLQKELLASLHYVTFCNVDGVWYVRHADAEPDQPLRIVCHVIGEETVTCSCKSFEFNGILCRHALAVLLRSNCFQIPDRYLLNRWRKLPPTIEPILDEVATINRVRVENLQPLVSRVIQVAYTSDDRYTTVMIFLRNAATAIGMSDYGIEHGGVTNDNGCTVTQSADIDTTEHEPLPDNPLNSRRRGRPPIRRLRSAVEQGTAESRSVRRPRCCGLCGEPRHDRRNCPLHIEGEQGNR